LREGAVGESKGTRRNGDREASGRQVNLIFHNIGCDLFCVPKLGTEGSHLLYWLDVVMLAACAFCAKGSDTCTAGDTNCA
jgi:hypothetical protein